MPKKANGSSLKPEPARAGETTIVDLGDGVKLELVRIPAGKFLRGSLDSDEDAESEEKPQREITISQPFDLGKYEVTVGQFRAFVNATSYKTDAERNSEGGFGYSATNSRFEGYKPQYHWRNVGWVQTADHPVVNVSWNDADAFCKWLQKKTGQKTVLPSEAQWEYACRAGSKTRYHSGDSDNDLRAVANVADVSFKGKFPGAMQVLTWDDSYPFTAPVGRFKPNALGLYDMHGNVWEWCADWYKREYYKESPGVDPPGPDAGEYRVQRGGSFAYTPRDCRSAYRLLNVPSSRFGNLGIRIAVVR